MSTAATSESNAMATLGLPQKTCARVACRESMPDTKCCDDNCIVEIARRDCNSEPGHRYQGTNTRHRVIGDSTHSIRLDAEPCESHYLKAKEAYSGILDNIGCICKVLLLLNLDSCCVPPNPLSLSDKAWEISVASGFLAELKKASNATSRKSSSSSTVPKLVVGSHLRYKDDHPTGLTTHEHETSVKANENDGCKVTCCRGSADNVAQLPPNSEQSCMDNNTSCCTTTINIDSSPDVSAETTNCCSKKTEEHTSTETKRNHSHITGSSDCCEQTITCCSDDHPSTIDAAEVDCHGEMCCSDSTIPKSDLDISHKSIFDSQDLVGKYIDLEAGQSQFEHVVLSVQGMTCTGCEKNLYRSLKKIPAISNIKTSLLLAQAEFDLRDFPNNDVVKTIKTIERMTGFTCTKMTQSVHELDLIVCEFASDVIEKDFPYGVSDITVLDRHTIRVTYQPKVIGARDLMSDPFFASPKLAPVGNRPLIASGRAHVFSMLLKTIISAVLTIPVLVLGWAKLPKHENEYGAASLVLATIVQIYVAGPWYISAFNALFVSHLVEMDMLVVLSTTIAYVYSIIAYALMVAKQPLSTGSFFETSTLLVTLIMVGRLVSGYARQKAVELISIESLQPSTAILTDPETRENQEIDARLLQYQDIFTALPDTAIATDGTVIAGISEVDESMITGEATLVTKKIGSPVVAGSLNHSGTLTVRLTHLPGENTIKTIGMMVDEAKLSKTNIQEIADRVATIFIPTIVVVTVLVFVIWVAVGKAIHNQDATSTCINAMTYAISALIVSCPCAIGLAVPMVLVVAGGVAARHGLIFKTASTIEIARNLSHVIFDKTGTLTQGSLTIEVQIYKDGYGEETLAPMLLGLTGNSKHPVSTAVASHLKSSDVQPAKLDKMTSIPGSGIEASWNGEKVRAGNPYWLGVSSAIPVKEQLHLGMTLFCVTINDNLVAIFSLRDVLRTDAIQVVNELKKRHIQISIVSGDNQESVKSVAQLLGIPESNVKSRCSPADKQTYVKQMLLNPKSVVMFCGDGTNDAVALTQASIGMHINGGTDIAQSAADAVLVRPALIGIIILVDLSKAFYRRVLFNFAWSFIYNTFAILLAAGAFPRARIPPQYAGLGEIVSVLPVILIGMHLRLTKFQVS